MTTANQNKTFDLKNDLSITESINSLKTFIETTTSRINDQQSEYKKFYSDYLTMLELDLIPEPPYATLRKADNAFGKITSVIDRFLAALKEDQFVAVDLTNQMAYLQMEKAELITRAEKKPKNLPQLIVKIKNLKKQFKELAEEYQSIVMNMFELQSSVKDQTIVYTSQKNKEFRIMIKQSFDEFLNILGVNDETGMIGVINAKFAAEFQQQFSLLDDDDLEQVLSLDPVGSGGTPPENQGRKGSPGENRESILVDASSLVAKIDLKKLKNDRVIDQKADERVMNVLLQSSKAELRQLFAIGEEFSQLPDFKKFEEVYATVLPQQSCTTRLKDSLEKLKEAYGIIIKHSQITSINDILNCNKKMDVDGEEVQELVEAREQFLWNWLIWTKIICMYLIFLKKKDSAETDETKKRLKLARHNIRNYLYDECVKIVKQQAAMNLVKNDWLTAIDNYIRTG